MSPSESVLPAASPPADTTTREYGRTRLSRISAYMLKPVIGVGIIAAYLYVINGTLPGGGVILVLIALVIIIGIWLAFGFANAATECFTLAPTQLEYTNRSGTRTFVLDDIDSYSNSARGSTTRIYFKGSGNPDISFNSSIERYQEIQEWLAARYPNRRLLAASVSSASPLTVASPADSTIQEYGRTRLSRIRAYVFNPVFGVGIIATYIYIYFVQDPSPGGWSILVLAVLILIIGPWLVFGFANANAECFTLGPNQLAYTDRSGTQTFALTDIDSYSSSAKYTTIEIHFKAPRSPDILFDSSIERYQEIQHWLAARYSDRRLVVVHKEKQRVQLIKKALLANPEIGANDDERAQALRKARKVSHWLNGAGILTALYLWLPPEPTELGIMAGVLVPLAATGALWWYPKLLRLDGSDGNGYPSVLMGVGLPSLGVWVASNSYYELVSYANLWPVVAAASVVMLLLLAWGSRRFLWQPKLNFLLIALLLPTAFLYGFSTCSIANVQYDTSQGRTFTAQVLSHTMSHGKHQDYYYLELSAWGPYKTIQLVPVSYAAYQRSQDGVRVSIVLHAGLLGTPWYRVEL